MQNNRLIMKMVRTSSNEINQRNQLQTHVVVRGHQTSLGKMLQSQMETPNQSNTQKLIATLF